MRKRLVDTKIGVGEMKRALFALIILMCVAAAASAAQFFTEDFSGGTLPGNMELTTHWAHPSLYGGSLTEHVDYGNNYAHWEEMTYYRQYIRTKDSDYSSVSFVFEATVTVTNASYGEVIYGMGDVTGTVGSGQPGHPCIGAMESKHSTRRYKLISTADNDDGLTDASWGNFSNANRRPNPKEAPFRVRMEWDATAKTATMSIDSNFDGIFNADQSFVISSNEVAGADGLTGGVFDASNSHLFIGGGFGVTVDDISVFPALPQEVSETALAHWRFENGEAGQTHAVDNDDWYRDVSGHANHLSSLSSSLRPLISASVPFDRVARVGPNELSLDFVGGDNVGTYNGSKMIQGYSLRMPGPSNVHLMWIQQTVPTWFPLEKTAMFKPALTSNPLLSNSFPTVIPTACGSSAAYGGGMVRTATLLPRPILLSLTNGTRPSRSMRGIPSLFISRARTNPGLRPSVAKRGREVAIFVRL